MAIEEERKKQTEAFVETQVFVTKNSKAITSWPNKHFSNPCFFFNGSVVMFSVTWLM